MKEKNYARQIGEWHTKQSKRIQRKRTKPMVATSHVDPCIYVLLALLLSPHLLPFVGSTPLTKLALGPNYKNHPTRVISHLDDCEKMTGINEGKKCKLFGEDYFFKNIAMTDAEEAAYFTQSQTAKLNKITPMMTVQKSNPSRALYHATLLKMMSNDIILPQFTFFHEKNHQQETFYYGSPLIENFTPAYAVIQRFEQEGRTRNEMYAHMRKALETKIGRHNFKFLFVAASFIFDLSHNWLNWGYDQQQRLVFIDVDYPLPHLNARLEAAELSLKRLTDFGVSLTLADVKGMKIIYEQMLEKSPKPVDPAFDWSNEDYQTLIEILLKSCDHTIQNRPSADDQKASLTINKALINYFMQECDEIMRIALFYQHAF